MQRQLRRQLGPDGLSLKSCGAQQPVDAHAHCQAAVVENEASSHLQAVKPRLCVVARQHGGQCGRYSCPLQSAGVAERRPAGGKAGQGALCQQSLGGRFACCLGYSMQCIMGWMPIIPVIGSSHADTACHLTA